MREDWTYIEVNEPEPEEVVVIAVWRLAKKVKQSDGTTKWELVDASPIDLEQDVQFWNEPDPRDTSVR
jgi:hypothetical protein